jgi:hypothetical protein
VPPVTAGAPAWIAATAFTLVLLLAPATSNAWWGVNALRSLPVTTTAALVLVAIASSRLAHIENRSVTLRWAAAIGVAWVLAFPLRESIHFLGDTQLRLRTMAMAGAGWIPLVSSWWSRLHANPLDIAVDILLVHALQRLGLGGLTAVSTVSWLLGVAFFAGCWRLAGRLARDGRTRWGLTAAIAAAGTLQAFAGYAESAGIVAVTAVWWWAEASGPLANRRQAWRTVAAFLAVALAHRAGIVLGLALLVRAAGPRGAWDEDGARRTLLLGGLGAIALVVAAAFATGVANQYATDAGDLMNAFRNSRFHAFDLLNGLALVAPLALLSLFASGASRRVEWLRSPAAVWTAAAAAPRLFVLGFLYPSAAHHLGAHREWESQLLTGITLTAAAASLLGGLETARRRAVLAVLLPPLVLSGAAWVVANSDPTVATARATTLAERPSNLTPAQTGYLDDYLGQRAMDERRMQEGARRFEAAFDIAGNPRRALLACEAWLAASDLASARRALDKARSRGALSPELANAAQQLEAALDRARNATPVEGGAEP